MTFQYNATVVRLVDGDTLELDIDLGFKLTFRQLVRLYGINAPELNTPEGKITLARLNALIPPNTKIIINTLKDRKEKYGRYLGIIYLDSLNIAAQLIHEGLAKEYYP
jgi:endonuclease YncB( thermonuclease family)